MTELTQNIIVVGISIITSNEEAFIQNTIGNLWQSFLASSIHDRLASISPAIYAVYSDYESNEQGKYRFTLGYAVSDTEEVPEDLNSITIPGGKYKIYPAKTSTVEDIIETWQTIWNTDKSELPRAFNVDFEKHTGNQTEIFISCK